MAPQEEAIDHLLAAKKRQNFFVMVGGACTTLEWATRIKTGAYGETAADAVALAKAYAE